MKTSAIREEFLDFFERNGHQRVRSSALVPSNDPSLLFTNAGMVQFKDVFLGHEQLPFKRATSSQRCVRAGGKHNDLENVGYTARHHTFFEMLGNFSFGDYFKREAINLSWELITQVFNLDPKRLLVTVYEEDSEAYEIWRRDINLPVEKIIKIGDSKGGQKYQSDNFWQMGDTGPCGPCSEIFWDHGSGVPGGPPGSENEDGDRFIEIWNLVFMQYNRDETGMLKQLPKPSVDTGMGLERMAAVLQNVSSNYEIDIFKSLIRATGKLIGTDDLRLNSLKVIADHIRACSFLILDGVIPGNEGRGYVLRRIIRRAARHGYKLGQTKPFLHLLTKSIAKEMGDAYPELRSRRQEVAIALEEEEKRFVHTLEKGMELLNAAMSSERKKLDGNTVFRLYDTYGFPIDLTADIAREKNIDLDLEGFESEMTAQRERARASSKFQKNTNLELSGQSTVFVGYKSQTCESNVVAIIKDSKLEMSLESDERGIIVLDRTPFYSESGGQVGDRGLVRVISKEAGDFEVNDTQAIKAGIFGHIGVMSNGAIKVGDRVTAIVDEEFRNKTTCNHSATHLLHAALRNLLGNHVQQKGSLVDETKLRFDFSHGKPITADIQKKIEIIVNHQIMLNNKVLIDTMSYDEAVAGGALALFGEKYADIVRVVDIENFSKELCGGTHVSSTGEIGFFKITEENGVASGIRRIEAATGRRALNFVQKQDDLLKKIKSRLKVGEGDVEDKIIQTLENLKILDRENESLKHELATSTVTSLLESIKVVGEVRVLTKVIENLNGGNLRGIMDIIKNKIRSGVAVLATVGKDNKITIVAGVTDDLTNKFKAGDLANFVAEQVGGRGGGKEGMGQGGGINPENLNNALKSVELWLHQGTE